MKVDIAIIRPEISAFVERLCTNVLLKTDERAEIVGK